MIHVCRPSITRRERKWVKRALKKKQVSGNSWIVDLFEKRFAEKIGTKYCVSCNSGTSALFLTLWALGIREGDEVIIPTFTMIATANVVKQCGATPVLVDAEYDTGNINADLIEKKITKKTKAIIPVHIYGHPCDMDKIQAIAKAHNLFIVEDACEAHGATYQGKTVGSFGVAGCFSFFANKIISTGEGGAICTNDKNLAEELYKLRAHYFSPKRHFDHKKMAFGLRMNALSAALGLGQLERWDKLIGNRIKNAKFYNRHLCKLADTPIRMLNCGNVYWMYWIKVGKHRDRLMKFLEMHGVETRTGFFPIHWQRPYKENGKYPIADILGKTSLYIPSSSDLGWIEKLIIVSLIKKYFKKHYAGITGHSK